MNFILILCVRCKRKRRNGERRAPTHNKDSQTKGVENDVSMHYMHRN